MGRICVFFGHANLPINTEQQENLSQIIIDLIKNHNVDTFWVGDYGQFDSIASHTVKQLQKTYPKINLELALSYLPINNKEILDYKLNFYNNHFLPEGVELVLPKFAIVERNKWLAQNCDFVVCKIDNNWGGAYKAVKIAIKANKKIINIGSLKL